MARKWKELHDADLSALVWINSNSSSKLPKIRRKSGPGSIKNTKTISSSPEISSGKKSVPGTHRVQKQPPLVKAKIPSGDARLAIAKFRIKDTTRVTPEIASKDVTMTGTSTPKVALNSKNTDLSTSEPTATKIPIARQKSATGLSQLTSPYFIPLSANENHHMSIDVSPIGQRGARGRGRRGGRNTPMGQSHGDDSLRAHNQTAYEKFAASGNKKRQDETEQNE